jgi:CheY-like chemotaxis protein
MTATNVKVLLVDDNPMVLGLLRQVLASFANVQAVSNAAEALLLAIDDPPDLLVTDYHMPGMDGRQLAEKLHARANTARVPIVILAARSDITEHLRPVQDSFEDIVEKPFFAREAGRRLKRVVDKIALEKMARSAAGSSGAFHGTLAQMNIIDLVQSLEMGRKNCRLILTRNGERCEMFFDEGQVRHATCGQITGDEAVFRALQWPPEEGNFEIDFNARTEQQTTTLSTQGLLMEGLKLLDEANRDSVDV